MGKGALTLTKSRFWLGLLVSYTSYETYVYLRTQNVIYQRKDEYDKLMKSLSKPENRTHDVDYSKFKSATVGGMFVNPFEEYRPQTVFEFLIVRLMEIFENVYGNFFEVHRKVPEAFGAEIEEVLKPQKPDLELLKNNSAILRECINSGNINRSGKAQGFSLLGFFRNSYVSEIRNQMNFTWLGQSCSFIQVSGINFLTDPIIGGNLFLGSLGPQRLAKAPMTIDDIRYAAYNNLDFVLISHDHPDHLEMDLVKKLGNKSTWVVPIGLGKRLARQGIHNVIEMDWWDTVPLNRYIGNTGFDDHYEITCVPAMHWSGRFLFDGNKSLWGSYIVKRNGQSLFYHIGDTGYLKELFHLIGAKNGPIYLSLLPIGQYCPSWHQTPRHISPSEAFQISKDVSSKFSMGIHWGTFKLSSEPILEPKFLLESLARNAKESDRIIAPLLGKTYVYDLQDMDC